MRRKVINALPLSGGRANLKNMLSWFKKNYLLISIILIGVIIRFLFLLKYGDFWHDEFFSFIYSQKAWPQGLSYWLWETNPPLHLLILKLWFFIFPANEFWARIPSLIFGTSTIISVYFLAKLIWNKNVALLSAFFISLHSINIFWSATARVYSLLMLLSSLSVYYFYKIFFFDSHKKRDKIFLGIITTLLLLSHLSAILLIFTQAIIIFAINRQKFFKWLKINLIPFIIAGSWLIPSFLLKQNNELEKTWLLNLYYDFWSAGKPLINIIAGVHYYNLGFFIISILIALVFIISILRIKKSDLKYTGILTIIIIPIIITLLFGIWHVKMLLYTLPFWVILIAYSINKISPNKIIAGWIIFSFCLIGIINIFALVPLTSWEETSTIIKNQWSEEENTILIYNNFFLYNQINSCLKLPFTTQAFDLAREPNMSWDELITQKNYLYLYFSETEIDNWFIEKNLNQYDKIFLLQGEYDYATLLNQVLEKNNFIPLIDGILRPGQESVRIGGPAKSGTTQKDKIRLPIIGKHYLYTYVKDDQTTSTIQ
ncbi:MAG: glycosyltransferase family 39 protein [Candidatus Magasanikbacteria bacterium]